MECIVRISSRTGGGGAFFRGDPEAVARYQRVAEHRGDRVEDGPRPLTAEEQLTPRQRNPRPDQ